MRRLRVNPAMRVRTRRKRKKNQRAMYQERKKMRT
jgi:hypothetical protein